MSAITLIVFGLIGFWVYYSVKHEGIYWIPRTGAGIGGFLFCLWMMFKIFREVQPTLFAVFLVICVSIVLTKIGHKIVFWADN